MNEIVFTMNTGISWSPLELRGLVEDEDSHVNFERATRHIGLHPFHLTDLNAALREILGSALNSYDETLNGIIISYKNPKLLSKMGEVLYDSCYIHIDVEVDFYVFRPKVETTLKGIVNKKSKDHVGILVHKAFNVSIPMPDDSDRNWPGHEVNLGQEVRFTVTHLDFKRRLPYIRGSFDPEEYLEGCKPFDPELDVGDETEVKSENKKLLFGDDGEIIGSPSGRVGNKPETFDSESEEEMENKVSLKKQQKIIGSPSGRVENKPETFDIESEEEMENKVSRKKQQKIIGSPSDRVENKPETFDSESEEEMENKVSRKEQQKIESSPSGRVGNKPETFDSESEEEMENKVSRKKQQKIIGSPSGRVENKPETFDSESEEEMENKVSHKKQQKIIGSPSGRVENKPETFDSESEEEMENKVSRKEQQKIESSPSGRVENKPETFDSESEEEMENKVSRKEQQKIEREPREGKQSRTKIRKKSKVKAEVEEATDRVEIGEVKTKKVKKMKNKSSNDTETSIIVKEKKKLKVHPDEMSDKFSKGKEKKRMKDESRDDVETSMKAKKKSKIKNENDASPSRDVTVKAEPESDEYFSKKKIKKKNVDNEVHESGTPKKKKKEKLLIENTISVVNSTRIDGFQSESTTKIKPEVQLLDDTIISGHWEGLVKKPKKRSLKLRTESEETQRLKKEKVTSSDDSSIGKYSNVKGSVPKEETNDIASKQSKKKHSADSTELSLSAKNKSGGIPESRLEKNKSRESKKRKADVTREETGNEKKKRALPNGSAGNISNHNVSFGTDDADDGMNDFVSPEVKNSKISHPARTNDNIDARRESPNFESSDDDFEKSVVKTEPTERKKSKTSGAGDDEDETLPADLSDTEQDTASILKELEAVKAKYEALSREIKRRAKIKGEVLC